MEKSTDDISADMASDLLSLPLLTSCAALAITSILLARIWIQKSRESVKIAKSGGRPLPGPWGIPVFGNMLSLDWKNPHLSLMNLAKVYGNTFQIRLGSRPVLVLNGLDAIRKALVGQSVTFAGRPSLFSFNLFNSSNKYGPSVSFSNYSDRWKLHRKLAETSLLHFTEGNHVKFIEAIVKTEADEVVQDPKNIEPPRSRTARRRSSIVASSSTDIRDTLRLTVSKMILWALFSKQSSYDDEKLTELLDLTDRFTETSGSGNPQDFLPWLRFFPNKMTKNLEEFRLHFNTLIGEYIDSHQAQYKDGSERDIMDCLVTRTRDLNQKELDELGISDYEMLQTAVDMFVATFETVSITLEWCILYMAAYPHVQDELQQEIDQAVGHDRSPTLDDRPNLPLTQSCLLEIQRHASVSPFSIPHSTTADTVLEGYFVPKDTLVFVNLYSAHYDPTVWKDPEVFDPRRFLTPDGKIDEEKRNLIIPFSLGSRRCLGSDLARINFFIYFSTFLHQLTFSGPKGGKVNLEAAFGLARRAKEFEVRVHTRF